MNLKIIYINIYVILTFHSLLTCHNILFHSYPDFPLLDWLVINPKRIMWGPRGPRKTSTDDSAAIIGTQEPIFFYTR